MLHSASAKTPREALLANIQRGFITMRSVQTSSANKLVNGKAVAVEATDNLLTSQNIIKIRAEHRKKLKSARKLYYIETTDQRTRSSPSMTSTLTPTTSNVQSKVTPPKLKISKDKQTTSYTGDPLVVGTVASKRSRKSLRLWLGGRFPSLGETLAFDQLHKRRKIKKDVLTSGEAMVQLYKRDLSVDNPRLVHLTHLFHSTKHFITPRTLSTHIEKFWKSQDEITTRSLFEKILYINEFGTPTDQAVATGKAAKSKGNGTAYFDPQQLGVEDKDFTTDPNRFRKTLVGGDMHEQHHSREQILTDRLTGTIIGDYGVGHVLEWTEQNGNLLTPPKISSSTPKHVVNRAATPMTKSDSPKTKQTRR